MKTRTSLCGIGVIAVTLGMAGCGTEPSGGKLPPPPAPVSAEQAKADFSKVSGEMYAEMGKQGNAGTQPPGAPPGEAP